MDNQLSVVLTSAANEHPPPYRDADHLAHQPWHHHQPRPSHIDQRHMPMALLHIHVDATHGVAVQRFLAELTTL